MLLNLDLRRSASCDELWKLAAWHGRRAATAGLAAAAKRLDSRHRAGRTTLIASPLKNALCAGTNGIEKERQKERMRV
jgi:hypothetical protein